MKQINLEIPENHEIDLEKSSLGEGRIIFKKKEIKLPTTNEECVIYLPNTCYYIDNEGYIFEQVGIYNKAGKNTLTTEEYAEAFIALMQLIKYRDIWNEGWLPDWKDDSLKYVIYFYREEKNETSGSLGRVVLSFKTSKLRDKFSETFDDLIQQAKPLL